MNFTNTNRIKIINDRSQVYWPVQEQLKRLLNVLVRWQVNEQIYPIAIAIKQELRDEFH